MPFVAMCSCPLCKFYRKNARPCAFLLGLLLFFPLSVPVSLPSSHVWRPPQTNRANLGSEKIVDRGQLLWEYKLADTADAQVHGPFATEQMLEWWEAGYFNGAGVRIRSVDDDGDWTKGTEIDFSLFP